MVTSIRFLFTIVVSLTFTATPYSPKNFTNSHTTGSVPPDHSTFKKNITPRQRAEKLRKEQEVQVSDTTMLTVAMKPNPKNKNLRAKLNWKEMDCTNVSQIES